MFGFGKSEPVAEYQATGEIDRVYHEIRQTLRVSGVNLNFRTWAAEDNLLPVLWDAVRSNCETIEFEEGADQLRTAAADAAITMGRLEAAQRTNLGTSQALQVQSALKLYHYVNPKLLLLTAAVRAALAGESQGEKDRPPTGYILPGVPPQMSSMEMEEEEPDDERIRDIFEGIKDTLSLQSINSDYRTLALWPDYLDAVWSELQPRVTDETYRAACDALRERAHALAAALPLKIDLSREKLEAAGADWEKAVETAASFQQLLPGLIVNISLCLHDWADEDELVRSPFPPEVRSPNGSSPSIGQSSLRSGSGDDQIPSAENAAAARCKPATAEMDWRDFQSLQQVTQLGDRFISYVDQAPKHHVDQQGDPIILLHGIPTWGYMWREVLPELASGSRTLVPDLPGFGFSDRRDIFDRSIARQAEMIDAWMQTLGIERATFVAHDIGGGVALRLATLFAQRVSRLCLLNTICYDSWPIELMLQFGHPWAYRKVSASGAIGGLRLALKSGFASSPGDEVMDGLLAPYRTEVGERSLVRNAAALNTNLTTEITHLLPRINVPTLVLWGADDEFQLMKFGERLAGDIPGAELVRIADARHFVMIDQPKQVIQHLNRFLPSAGKML